IPDVHHLSLVQDQALVTDSSQGGQTVGDDDQGFPGVFQFLHLGVTFLFEILVPHRQYLIDQDDVGIDVDGDGEAEPLLQSGGVRLHGCVDGILQLRELDDFRVNFLNPLLIEPEDGAVEADVFRAGQIPVQSRPQLDEGSDFAVDLHITRIGADDSAQNLEKGAFSGSVSPDNGEGFSLLDREGDAV